MAPTSHKVCSSLVAPYVCPPICASRRGNPTHVSLVWLLPSGARDAWPRWDANVLIKPRWCPELQDGSRAGARAGERQIEGCCAVLFSSSSAMLILKDSRLLLPRTLGWGGRSTLHQGASAPVCELEETRCIWTTRVSNLFGALVHACWTSVVQPARGLFALMTADNLLNRQIPWSAWGQGWKGRAAGKAVRQCRTGQPETTAILKRDLVVSLPSPVQSSLYEILQRYACKIPTTSQS